MVRVVLSPPRKAVSRCALPPHSGIPHPHNDRRRGSAAHVGCSRRTLEIRFKKTTGWTVLEEIQHCRAARAKSMLLETDMPLKQIIHRADFQSREYMRLFFKKLLGATPGSLQKIRQKTLPH